MKIRIIAVGMMAFAVSAIAGNKTDKFGATPQDSVECVKNLSLYTEFFKQKNHHDALGPWRESINYCPKYSKSLYINGIKMFKKLAKEDKENREAYVDTIMWLYDQRIEHFGQQGYVLGRKGSDQLKYRRKAPEQAYETLKQSYELEGNKMGAGAVASFYKALYYMYKKKDADKEKLKTELLELYPVLSGIIKYNIENQQKERTKEMYKKAQQSIDANFEPIADCPDLIQLYTPKFEQTPNDTTMLETLTGLLEKKECTSEELYFKAASALVALKPTARAYYSVAVVAATNNNCKDAIENFKKCAEIATDDVELKEKALLKVGKCYLKLGQFSAARQFSNQALAVNSNSGEAHLIIGEAYAASAGQCGDNDCANKAAFWVAVDRFAKAKAVDPELAEKANAKITAYKKHFPNQEKCFFYGITEGSTYKVECWINESTTVRLSK